MTFILLILLVVAIFIIIKLLNRPTPAAVAAVPARTAAPAMVDFATKQAELVKLLDRLSKAIDLGFEKEGKPGTTFKLVPLREAIHELAGRARRATTEDQLALLFIEARRLFDQVNQILELPREFFLRDARQAQADGISAERARERGEAIRAGTAPAPVTHPSGITFWDWYTLHSMLFSDAHGRPREDYLRSTVQQVYEEIPDWVTKTGGEAIPDVLQQIDMPVADWQSSSLDSVVANDWQAIRTDSGDSGASGAADDSDSRTSDDSADSASDASASGTTY